MKQITYTVPPFIVILFLLLIGCLQFVSSQNMENINFYYLKNNEQRKIAFDKIMSSLTYRTMNSSHLESLIVNDDNIDCTTDILKKMNDIVVVIWNDDLNKNQTYLHLLIRLAQITKNPFPLEITSITDDYLTTEENCEFKFAFVSREKNHEVKLKKGLYLDYRFLKPIIEATEASQNNGKFYLVDDEKLDGGFCFIYLDNKEYNTIIDNGIIRVYELTTELIDEINIWVD